MFYVRVSADVGADGIGQEFRARASKRVRQATQEPVYTRWNTGREEHWRIVGVSGSATLRFHRASHTAKSSTNKTRDKVLTLTRQFVVASVRHLRLARALTPVKILEPGRRCVCVSGTIRDTGVTRRNGRLGRCWSPHESPINLLGSVIGLLGEPM